MSDELVEKIAEIYHSGGWKYASSRDAARAILALISASSLSQPSGVEAVRRCLSCGANGQIDTLKDEKWTTIICECKGTGKIVRELTVAKALELLKEIIPFYKDWESHEFLPGERLRIKENK